MSIRRIDRRTRSLCSHSAQIQHNLCSLMQAIKLSLVCWLWWSMSSCRQIFIKSIVDNKFSIATWHFVVTIIIIVCCNSFCRSIWFICAAHLSHTWTLSSTYIIRCYHIGQGAKACSLFCELAKPKVAKLLFWFVTNFRFSSMRSYMWVCWTQSLWNGTVRFRLLFPTITSPQI